MKLQTQLNRVVNNKQYRKFILVMPAASVESSGWKEGDELFISEQGYGWMTIKKVSRRSK